MMNDVFAFLALSLYVHDVSHHTLAYREIRASREDWRHPGVEGTRKNPLTTTAVVNTSCATLDLTALSNIHDHHLDLDLG